MDDDDTAPAQAFSQFLGMLANQKMFQTRPILYVNIRVNTCIPVKYQLNAICFS